MTRRDLEARYADKSTTPLPPPDHLKAMIRTCSCGGAYLDMPAGHDSHELVFNHRPRAPDDRKEQHTDDHDRDDERE